MEDSTFEGWTTPLPPGVMDYPTGRRVEDSPHKPGFRGETWSLPKATEDSIRYASRSWPQGRLEDFDREGRTYTERATGTVYKLVHGNVLLGDDTDAADLFLVEGDALWFLRRADAPRRGKSVVHGTVAAGWPGR